MRSRQPRPFSEHHLARFLVWFVMVLGWFAFGAPLERRQRRFGYVTCATLQRAARNLIIIRAANLCRHHRSTPWRDFARSGFQRRQNRCSLRAVGGKWLRKRLNARAHRASQAPDRNSAPVRHPRGRSGVSSPPRPLTPLSARSHQSAGPSRHAPMRRHACVGGFLLAARLSRQSKRNTVFALRRKRPRWLA